LPLPLALTLSLSVWSELLEELTEGRRDLIIPGIWRPCCSRSTMMVTTAGLTCSTRSAKLNGMPCSSMRGGAARGVTAAAWRKYSAG
jgi:hypothetical protein